MSGKGGRTMNETTRADTLRALQELVDFLEVNTEVKLPALDFPIYFFGSDKTTREEAKKLARVFRTFKKSESGYYLTLHKEFGSDVILRAVFIREAVCTKRVVGTRKVMKSIYPKSVVPAPVEVEEDIIEWDCPPLLQDDGTSPASDNDIPDDEIPY